MITSRDLNSVHIQEFFSHLPSGIDYVLKRKNIIFKKDVLEIGCGDGNTIIDVANKFAVNAYTIDKEIPKRYKDMRKVVFIQYNLKDIENLYVKKLKFDFRYSFRVFLHLDMQTRINVVEYILNSLNEGGIAIIDYSGDYSKRRFDSNDDDNYLILKLNEIKPKNIEIRHIEKIMYRADYNLVEDIHKPLFKSEEIAFNGNILIIQKKK